MLMLIGDVIQFEGYVVGRLSSSIPPTIRYAVEDRFSYSNEAHNAFDMEQLKSLIATENNEDKSIIDNVVEKLVPLFQAGLLDRADFDKAISKIKEELE